MTLKKILSQSSGQALVVLLLILVVALTIGLSVVARTITNVRESSTTERSTRAFSAAEAGIETVLRQDIPTLLGNNASTTPMPITVGSAGNAQAVVTISKSGAETDYYQPIKPISKDDVIQLTIDPTGLSNAATQVDVMWSLASSTDENGACSSPFNLAPAAIEITVISQNGSNYPIDRYVRNPYGCIINSTFTGNPQPGTTDGFVSKERITFPASPTIPKIMRIRPLYNTTGATIRVKPVTGQLPVQSYRIRSEGTVQDTKRVVEVERSIGGLPAIFDYVLYNGSASVPLSKN